MLLWMEVRSLRGLFLSRLAYTDGERMGWYEMEIKKEGYGGAAGRQAHYLPAARCSGRDRDSIGGGGYLLRRAVSCLHGGVHHGAAAAHLLGGDFRQTLRHLLRRGVGECKSAVSQFRPTALVIRYALNAVPAMLTALQSWRTPPEKNPTMHSDRHRTQFVLPSTQFGSE